MINEKNITPFENELPTEYADRLGVYYTKQVSTKHKKDSGQFFTPIPIANLMASYSNLDKKALKILDPGFGMGILSCALIEQIAKRSTTIINLVVYETDHDLIIYSKQVLEYLKAWLLNKKIDFTYDLLENDFISEKVQGLKKFKKSKDGFDIIISNPPYFKLPKDDIRTLEAKELLGTQPNIYSIFMGISANLLKDKGELIFITPRSFASGNYFKLFREHFFSKVQLEKVHLFNSRKDTFNRDSVLQETVIMKARKEVINPNAKILVSSSIDIKDITNPTIKYFNSSELIDLKSNEKILHLPTTEKETRILNLVSTWRNNLIDHDIQISTGPVVSFRSLKYIQNIYENSTVFLAPLFWLHNVNKMILEWPKQLKDKGQFIRIEQGSKSMLIPNKNYVFLRRFSTKDDKSRLIAAPYFCNYVKSEFIGVENKVNYIYRKNGHLERDELVGLCALLNSELFDTYFQIFNGNVNVSATELREMRFPSLTDIKEIGNKIIISNDFSMGNVNRVVNSTFDLIKIF